MKKELLKRIFVGLVGGITISYIITIIISLAFKDGNYYSCVPSLITKYGSEINAVIIQTLLSAVLGAVFSGASIIWEMDNWSLLKQTGLHFIIVSTTMMSVAYICEWMEHSVKGFVSYFSIFFAIFIVVWILQYTILKIKISRLKTQIEEINK